MLIQTLKRTVLGALGCLFLAPLQAAEPPQSDLISALRGGGYSIYFRHEATDWSQSDQVTARDDWLNCSPDRMRQLSNRGRDRAARIGRAMRALGIPVSKLYSSPYCRCMETARLMNLGPVIATAEVMNLRVADYFGGRSAIVQSARALLSREPAAGTNHVIVAHGNVARESTPVYPDEGEGVVFRPNAAGGFDVIGRVSAQQWQQLAQALQ